MSSLVRVGPNVCVLLMLKRCEWACVNAPTGDGIMFTDEPGVVGIGDRRLIAHKFVVIGHIELGGVGKVSGPRGRGLEAVWLGKDVDVIVDVVGAKLAGAQEGSFVT